MQLLSPKWNVNYLKILHMLQHWYIISSRIYLIYLFLLNMYCIHSRCAYKHKRYINTFDDLCRMNFRFPIEAVWSGCIARKRNTNAPNTCPLVLRCRSKPEKLVTRCLCISDGKRSSALRDLDDSCKANSATRTSWTCPIKLSGKLMKGSQEMYLGTQVQGQDMYAFLSSVYAHL